MSYEALCCPECGCDTFHQTRTVRVEFEVNVRDYGIADTGPESVQDAGEKDEDPLHCYDCGETFDPDTDELVTAAQYESTLDDEGGYR